MTRDSENSSRRSLRLRTHDYREPGIYAITICVQDHRTLLGKVVDDVVCLSPIGAFARTSWESLPKRFSSIELDVYVIMPNHFHGLIVITGSPGVCNTSVQTYPLGEVIRTFKALTTYSAHARGIVDFGWQEQYWDSIIRNERHLQNVRRYILNNPAKWALDPFYRAEVRLLDRLAARRNPRNSPTKQGDISLDELPF